MSAHAVAEHCPHRAPDLVSAFQAFIGDASFPCVGAKSALNRDQMQFILEDDLASGPQPATLARLQAFSRNYAATSPLFQSVVILFRNARPYSEARFEALLWHYLQRLHDADAAQFEWDPSVSKDAASPDFSFSIGGRGYYVVGLHPGASRAARRFSHPALVFNLHDQFERLRARGKYETLKASIIARDVQLEGDRNPMLKQFGTSSEARQYSGRLVSDDWVCPFHAR